MFSFPAAGGGGGLSKRTTLWGLFNLQKRPILFNPLPSGCTIGERNEGLFQKKYMQRRSRCPVKFAEAFFEANP